MALSCHYAFICVYICSWYFFYFLAPCDAPGISSLVHSACHKTTISLRVLGTGNQSLGARCVAYFWAGISFRCSRLAEQGNGCVCTNGVHSDMHRILYVTFCSWLKLAQLIGCLSQQSITMRTQLHRSLLLLICKFTPQQ